MKASHGKIGQHGRHWKGQARRTALWAVFLLALVAVSCESQPNMPEQAVQFHIEPAHRDITAGQMVMYHPYSENLVGHEHRIEWNASGGELEALDNGERARVIFDQPGRYTVSANLYVNDQLLRTSTGSVFVRPAP